MPKDLDEKEKLERAFDAVMSLPEGVDVLRHIFKLSGYQDPLLRTGSDGEANPLSTIYNLAKRDVWIDVRIYLDRDQRAKIECE